jgi:VPS62-like protein
MRLVVLVLCLACVGASPAAGAVDLLQTYEPVLLFHPSEHWAPEQVETFLADATVEKQASKGSWQTVAGALPTSSAGCVLTPCYRLNLPCPLHGGVACYLRMSVRAAQWQKPVVYGRVITTSSGFLVRYWLFYEFDDWHSLRSRLWQAHEGDWESISIGVDTDGKPQFAAYSQHCSGTVRSWTAVEKRGGTHPVAYVALGSHANYFTNAPSSTRFAECFKQGLTGQARAVADRITSLAQEKIVDRTGTAHPLGPAGLAGVTPLGLVKLDPAAVSWARFPGRWSEGQLLWLGTVPRSFTSVSQGYGPATPHWSSTAIPSLWHVDSS